jgi:hypothetical protein
MTPEEIRNLDRSKIYSMQMTSGDVFLVTQKKRKKQLKKKLKLILKDNHRKKMIKKRF